MKLELIRQLSHDDDTLELLFEVDQELFEVYRSETGDDEFDQDSFNESINDLIKYAVEGENSIDYDEG